MGEEYLAFLQVIRSTLFYCLICGYAVLFEINKISSLSLFLMFQFPQKYLFFKLVTWYETILSLSKVFQNLLLYTSLARFF